MYPSSNQPAKLYGTTKTHKFSSIDEINVQQLKFRPIIAQTGTCMHKLFNIINNYHPKITFTVEENPEKFLDTNIKITDGKVTTSVHRKVNKLPTHWSSRVPKRYKRNTINGDLHRSYVISSNFENEKSLIKEKYLSAGYPIRFIESVIQQFGEKLLNKEEENELIIPEFLFNEPKKRLLLEIPFCEENEIIVKQFQKKFHRFTHEMFDLIIKWKTKKIKQLFHIKDENMHPVCKVYEGICSCNVNYIGETKRNVEIRW